MVFCRDKKGDDFADNFGSKWVIVTSRRRRVVREEVRNIYRCTVMRVNEWVSSPAFPCHPESPLWSDHRSLASDIVSKVATFFTWFTWVYLGQRSESLQLGHAHICSAFHPRDHLSVGTLTVQHSTWLVRRRVRPRSWDLAPSPLRTPASFTHSSVWEQEGRGLSIRALVTRLMTEWGSRRLWWSEISASPSSLSAASFPTTPECPGQ